jgi:hypothetical protein
MEAALLVRNFYWKTNKETNALIDEAIVFDASVQ